MRGLVVPSAKGGFVCLRLTGLLWILGFAAETERCICACACVRVEMLLLSRFMAVTSAREWRRASGKATALRGRARVRRTRGLRIASLEIRGAMAASLTRGSVRNIDSGMRGLWDRIEERRLGMREGTGTCGRGKESAVKTFAAEECEVKKASSGE
jgi:hypothetical protein